MGDNAIDHALDRRQTVLLDELERREVAGDLRSVGCLAGNRRCHRQGDESREYACGGSSQSEHELDPLPDRSTADGSKERFTALRTMTVKKMNGQTLDGRSISSMAACDILHLVLGPLDLDLLGLQVHLNRVVLDIVAVAGAGNLLGNLLCAVAGLLDGGPLAGLLAQLTNLLNQILDALNLGI